MKRATARAHLPEGGKLSGLSERPPQGVTRKLRSAELRGCGWMRYHGMGRSRQGGEGSSMKVIVASQEEITEDCHG